MRKNVFRVLTIGLVIFLSSCGGKGGFEKDVRKSAKYRCQEQQLEAKAENDEKAQKELEDLRKEIEAFDDKMKEKYKGDETNDKMREKGQAIMLEEMAKCK